MKRILTTGFLLFLVFSNYAGKPDSLVFINELNYSSITEEKAFKELNNQKQSDFVTLFSTVDNTITSYEIEKIRVSVSDYIKRFQTTDFIKNKPGKKIKKIHNSIHSVYFEKYDYNTYFHQIFDNGVYNCVTSSALYGIVLNELQIPFTVKETMGHVFLVAYPETQYIVVEATNPYKGYYTFSKSFKENYKKYLLENKLISRKEFANKTAGQVFEEYYIKEKDINLKQLVGLLYYNKSFEKLEAENVKESYELAKKSFFLYPSEKARFILYITATALLSTSNYSDIKSTEYIYRISRFEDTITDNSFSKLAFLNATDQILISSGQINYYDEYFNLLNQKIYNPELKKEFSFIYHYERGRYFYNQTLYEDAKVDLEKSINIKPLHMDAQALFIQNFINRTEKVMAPEQIIFEIEHYNEKFPELRNNSKFRQIYLRAILLGSERNFDLGLTDKAFDYLEQFETLYPSMDNNYIFLNESIIRAYSAAATYYFKKGRYELSKQYIDKGLYYVPNNFELLNRRRALR
ncbi:MAG: hypothetical protein K8S16_21395 [Bacteroidales bacterium]|nr:hypothetical protein [Bacteroidales bacterium]